MFGVFVNMAAIIVGGIIGTLFKKGIPEKISKCVMEVMGLVSIFIGIQGALKGEKTLVVLVAMILGTIIGTLIDIDSIINKFGKFLKKKFVNEKSSSNAKFVDAFVSTSVLFGIGAMAILGSIDAGLRHDYHIFYLKSMMDGITSIMFATTMGIGVCFSSITILILQGSMTLFAGFLKSIAENVGMMNEITCCGNILIIAIGLNVIGLTKLKIANMLPAIILVPFMYYIYTLVL